jgi:anti-sigma factor RsiW
MKVLGCAATRRRLQAFHDRELPVADQIAVGSHLEWCPDCANQYSELRVLGAALRANAPGRAVASVDDEPSFAPTLVNRLKVEQDQAFVSRVREMFDDRHLVYAGVSATLATAACVVVMFGLMRFATAERPDSLAAIMNLLASPGSNEYPVAIDPSGSTWASRTIMPVALDAAISVGTASEGDAVFAMAAVVTREGLIKHLDLLDADDGGNPLVDEKQVVEDIMHAMSRTRFQPAQREGLPVAVNLVWLVAHTTVRGTPAPQPLDPAVPLVKKRSASLESPAVSLVG